STAKPSSRATASPIAPSHVTTISSSLIGVSFAKARLALPAASGTAPSSSARRSAKAPSVPFSPTRPPMPATGFTMRPILLRAFCSVIVRVHRRFPCFCSTYTVRRRANPGPPRRRRTGRLNLTGRGRWSRLEVASKTTGKGFDSHRCQLGTAGTQTGHRRVGGRGLPVVLHRRTPPGAGAAAVPPRGAGRAQDAHVHAGSDAAQGNQAHGRVFGREIQRPGGAGPGHGGAGRAAGGPGRAGLRAGPPGVQHVRHAPAGPSGQRTRRR